MRLTKIKLNFIIDIVMFIVMMMVVGVGFLMEYMLIPGSQRHEVYGRNVELYFWGFDRHQWGDVHLILGLILVFLLILHIVFHWKLIVAIYKRMFEGRILRVLLTIAIIIITVLLVIAPLFLKPQVVEGSSSHGREDRNELRRNDHSINEGTTFHTSEHEDYSVEIYGSMSLQEVADKYVIPVEDLASAIDVPVTMSGERLGRLKKDYGFDMNDLRDFVEEKIAKK
ncbi:DUF4405 domain-containing protein [Carboxylicivirga caseinilyticus]|uniref:DUF4405 domain-containing protein n=1 Tax=Carboxylicivirga caseinilyticus TaxID=3417572 RepID=UPI003D32CD44|nr:DUF4405 domain-containing protein [Marinilabiliaceae bacterium A049]